MKQHKTGELVIYGVNGVCEVTDIEETKYGQYYILHPVGDERTKLMVPLANEELVERMRKLPTKKEIQESLPQVKKAKLKWIEDGNARREHAKEILAEGSVLDVLVLIRTFIDHREKATKKGKKTTYGDILILRDAQDFIRKEFAAVLHMDAEKVDDYVLAHI